MVSFARARRRSLLSRLWPMRPKPPNNQTVDLKKSKNLIDDIQVQNKCLLEATKNGGVWFC
tara:strand:+ start:115 stop:297 length:183 start_codon:yes stop_codon:yes gene_type:complete